MRARLPTEAISFGSRLSRPLSMMLVLTTFPAAAAADCDAPLSPCVNASALLFPAGPGRFVSFEDSTVLAPAELSFGAVGSYSRMPLVLVAPSPASDGREVPLVEDIWQLDLALAAGVGADIQLGLVLPTRLAEDGTGIAGVASRIGPPLRSTAIVDPRLGASYQLFRGSFASKLRVDVSVPLGDEDSFAGESGLVLLPAASVGSPAAGAWHWGGELGLRLRPSTQLGDVEVGNQLATSVGLAYDVFQRLSVGLEAFVLVPLTRQPEFDGETATYVPAQWLASVDVPLGTGVSVLAAGGSGLPFSTSSDPEDSDRHLALTTPRYQGVVRLRIEQ